MSEQAASGSFRILVYSDDSSVRTQIKSSLGRRPAPELPSITVTECATHNAVISTMDAGGIDLAIFDGEAAPSGGMGLIRQLKDEIYLCPPMLLVIGRPQDAWLATWSRADAVVSHPIDPVQLAEATAALMRTSIASPA